MSYLFVLVSKYYRQILPHRIRHGIRQIPNLLKSLFQSDVFVDVESDVFRNKTEIIYSDNVNLFYLAPRDIQETITGQTGELKYKSSQNCIVLFKHVLCYGASDLIQLDNIHYFYEIRNYYKRVGKTGISSNDGVGLLVDERHFYNIRKGLVKERIKNGILLSSYFANNYYHFTFQCIAKLRLCDKIERNVPLLVHESVTKIPSFQQLLNICNVFNRKLIMLSDDKQYEVEKLYYISPQVISVPNYRVGAIKMPDDDLYSKESLTYIREKILPHMDNRWKVPKYVYLTRRFASNVRGYNDNECGQLLQHYGFVEVRPETLTLGQQVALFNKAECIVGASGAAFTNLVYASPNCRYVVLKGAHSYTSVFASLAAFNGAQLVYLCDKSKGELEDASLEHYSFHIELEELKSLIEQIIRKGSNECV